MEPWISTSHYPSIPSPARGRPCTSVFSLLCYYRRGLVARYPVFTRLGREEGKDSTQHLSCVLSLLHLVWCDTTLYYREGAEHRKGCASSSFLLYMLRVTSHFKSRNPVHWCKRLAEIVLTLGICTGTEFYLQLGQELRGDGNALCQQICWEHKGNVCIFL